MIWTPPYTPFYCEENVWHLCQDPQFAKQTRHVMFVFSRAGPCFLWRQQAAPRGQPVGWDYHVILLVHDAIWQVWDLDSRLPLPVAWLEYFAGTFGPTLRGLAELERQGLDTERFRPLCRIVSADEYIANFASDRSHMRDARGSWLHPPPSWPCIGTGHNLPQFLDPDDPRFGPAQSVREDSPTQQG